MSQLAKQCHLSPQLSLVLTLLGLSTALGFAKLHAWKVKAQQPTAHTSNSEVMEHLQDLGNWLLWKSHLHFEGFVSKLPFWVWDGDFHQTPLQTLFPFSRRCDLLGPEVISCQPGIVDLQQEVGIVNGGPKHLEGGR